MKKPATIVGIDKVADVDAVLRTILPWRLSTADALQMQLDETIMKYKEGNERQIVQLLERLRY